MPCTAQHCPGDRATCAADATLLQHETITQTYIRAVRGHLATSEGQGLAERVNASLLAPEGRRDWPLRFYSPERLSSRSAAGAGRAGFGAGASTASLSDGNLCAS